jgi:hypothetical protein
MKNCMRVHYKVFISKGRNPDQITIVNYTPPGDQKLNRRQGKKGRKDNSKIKCFNCGMNGHKKQECCKEGGRSYDPKKARTKKTDDKGDEKNMNKKMALQLLCRRTGHKKGRKQTSQELVQMFKRTR